MVYLQIVRGNIERDKFLVFNQQLEEIGTLTISAAGYIVKGKPEFNIKIQSFSMEEALDEFEDKLKEYYKKKACEMYVAGERIKAIVHYREYVNKLRIDITRDTLESLVATNA